jgi:hypothetical protein
MLRGSRIGSLRRPSAAAGTRMVLQWCLRRSAHPASPKPRATCQLPLATCFRTGHMLLQQWFRTTTPYGPSVHFSWNFYVALPLPRLPVLPATCCAPIAYWPYLPLCTCWLSPSCMAITSSVTVLAQQEQQQQQVGHSASLGWSLPSRCLGLGEGERWSRLRL